MGGRGGMRTPSSRCVSTPPPRAAAGPPPPGAIAASRRAGKLLLTARLRRGRPTTLHLDAGAAGPPVATLARASLSSRFALAARPRTAPLGKAGAERGVRFWRSARQVAAAAAEAEAGGRSWWRRARRSAPPPPSPLAAVDHVTRLRGFMRPARLAVELDASPEWAVPASPPVAVAAAAAPARRRRCTVVSPTPPPHPAPTTPLTLVNKAPHWNAALRCWCLNFRGRVKLASVKNFQLVASPPPGEISAPPPPPPPPRRLRHRAARREEDGGGEEGDAAPPAAGGAWARAAAALRRAPPPPPPPSPPRRRRRDPPRRVLVQFGKVDADEYVLDFDPTTVPPVAAFAAALSMFERRVGL